MAVLLEYAVACHGLVPVALMGTPGRVDACGRMMGDSDGSLRVLVVIPAMGAEAGAESSMAATMPHLIELGVDVHLAVFTPVQDLIPGLRRSGVVVHDLNGRRGLSLIRSLRSLLRSVRPDLVHATLFQAMIPSSIAVLATRAPLLVTWASTPIKPATSPIANWKLRVVTEMDRLASRSSSTRFHAVTQGVASTKMRQLGVAAHRVRVAERGRDGLRFRPPTPDERSACRGALGVGPDSRILLAVGRHEPEKGYVDLIAAFDDVVDGVGDIQLFIAGRAGNDTERIKDALGRNRHPDRVHLLGHRDDITDLLWAADAIVCASRREGAAGALIEAMGTRTPIVSVELDGLIGVLRHQENAIVVPRNRLAEGVIALFADQQSAATRADSARQMFEQRFTIERSSRALLDVYRWAAGLTD